MLIFLLLIYKVFTFWYYFAKIAIFFVICNGFVEYFCFFVRVLCEGLQPVKTR